jgi:hypothetical protein
VTLADVTNGAGYPATCSVEAEVEVTGPTVSYAGSLDTIAAGAVVGWSDKPAVTAANAGDYDLDTKALSLSMDGGAPVSIFFAPAKGRAWTIAETVASFTGAVGEVATNAGGKLRLGTDTSQGSIEITGGTANTAFGFPLELIKGFNSTDAVVGNDLETDPDFRLRREALLRVIGAGTVEAIRAKLLTIDDVIQAMVFENVELTTDGDGLPGKAFEAVVQGGDDQEIADAIWEVKPAGMLAHGDVTKTVTDSQDIDHEIKFSRPEEIPIFIDLEVTVDADIFPADGASQIETALKEYGDALNVGDTVYALAFKSVPLSIAGVLDVTAYTIDDVDPPVGSINIVLTSRQLATFDLEDINVSVA